MEKEENENRKENSRTALDGKLLACVASVSVQFGSKELQGDDSFPLPYPHRSFFGSRPIFREGKIPKTPFLGLSLLPNSTETLATQASKLRALKPVYSCR